MAVSRKSASVRWREALAALGVAFAGAAFLLPARAMAEAPEARTYALTPLEEGLIATPELEPGDVRQPVIGYVRLTEDGWRLDMLPRAVALPGPLPVFMPAVEATPEDATSLGIYPYIPLLRVDI